MTLRAAVIGVGYLGRFHAEKYAAHPDVDLVAVVDIDPARAAEVAAVAGAKAETDFRAILGEVDCVTVATPTPFHYEIAHAFLTHGVDVLVEKPMTVSSEEGRALVEVAELRGRVLQVGHLERFNPALRGMLSLIDRPRFIECGRLAPYGERGTDVDVVRDLMIHDLDVILELNDSAVERVEAVGIPVLSEQVDIANARLRFANGCIANVTASRVALKRERKIRLFQSDTYLSIDYGEHRARICRRRVVDGQATIEIEEQAFEDSDALRDEVAGFVAAVRTRSAPTVDGRDGLRAVELAERINACMESA